ncbi:uncharacterized protein MEPE_05210 [Melanopsichium pennsylvanicum]|uniref:Uncharacterized protein n=1 Tax=Melanopsichium pennsylvanicum TaxID=63383 RepID=A0AAJ4XRC6_9BASI|nr:uncharacterized protein MEPE_05210 [Melanopsichium pennsylvanicum]
MMAIWDSLLVLSGAPLKVTQLYNTINNLQEDRCWSLGEGRGKVGGCSTDCAGGAGDVEVPGVILPRPLQVLLPSSAAGSLCNLILSVGFMKHDVKVEKQDNNIKPNLICVKLVENLEQANLRDMMWKMQLIFTCTPSTTALFPSDYVLLPLQDGGNITKHIFAVGSCKLHKVELPAQVVQRALGGKVLLVDSEKECVKEAGCLLQALGQEGAAEGVVLLAGDKVGTVVSF